MFQLSKHAEWEIVRRQIPRAWVEATLNGPKQKIPQPDGTEIWQAPFDGADGRNYLLRIVVALDKNPPVVVTAYRTTKIERYWRTA